MLYIATELRPSLIHGNGVFLLEPVSKGQLISSYDPRIDRTYTEMEIAALPEVAQTFIIKYSCWHAATQQWRFYGDNDKFMNHSTTPNTHTDTGPFGSDFALMDLAAGTELTCDYFSICDKTRETGIL